MERRALGATGLQVSVVGIGTWQSYDVLNPADVQAVTDAALTGGASFFDTSPTYNGAERALAQVEDSLVVAQDLSSAVAESASELENLIGVASDGLGSTADAIEATTKVRTVMSRLSPWIGLRFDSFGLIALNVNRNRVCAMPIRMPAIAATAATGMASVRTRTARSPI